MRVLGFATRRCSLTVVRLLPDGPPLLKERRYLRKDAAEQLWKSLQAQVWKPLKTPAWGAAADV